MRIRLIYPDAFVPTKKYELDAGLDLYSYSNHEVPPHSFAVIETGISIEIPEGYFGFVTNKSRNHFLIGAGVVDCGYKGQVYIIVFNVLDKPLYIRRGQPVAQLVLVNILRPTIQLIDTFEFSSERESDGGILNLINNNDSE